MSTSVSSLLNSTSTTSTSSSSSSSNSSIDFDSYLELLTTELKYQDPSDPVSNTEYVSQMAQLSSLSQLNNIYSAISNSAAFTMIGQEVAYEVTDSSGTTTTYTGTVNSVISSNGNTFLNVDGTAVSLDAVVEVGTITASST